MKIPEFDMAKYMLYLTIGIIVIVVAGFSFPSMINMFYDPWMWTLLLLSIGFIYYTDNKMAVFPLAVITGLIPWLVIMASAIACAPNDWICNIWQSFSGAFLLIPRLIDLGLHIGVVFVILWLVAELIVRK